MADSPNLNLNSATVSNPFAGLSVAAEAVSRQMGDAKAKSKDYASSVLALRAQIEKVNTETRGQGDLYNRLSKELAGMGEAAKRNYGAMDTASVTAAKNLGELERELESLARTTGDASLASMHHAQALAEEAKVFEHNITRGVASLGPLAASLHKTLGNDALIKRAGDNVKEGGLLSASLDSTGLFKSFASLASATVVLMGVGRAFTGVWGAFTAIIEAASKIQKNFYGAGGALSSPDASLLNRDAFSFQAQAGLSQTGYVYNDDEMLSVIKTGRQYGTMLKDVGEAYGDGISRGTEFRNTMLALNASSLMQLGRVGVVFGLTSDETVKYTGQIGTSARANMGSATSAFVNLAMAARNLNFNMEPLLSSFQQIAEQSNAAGDATNSSLKTMDILTTSIRDLSTAGAVGFKNMNALAQENLLSSTIGNLTKMDDIRYAAITSRGGEGFGGAMDRTMNAGTGVRAKEIVLAMEPYMNSGNRHQDNYLLSAASGYTSTFKNMDQYSEVLRRGATMNMSDKDLSIARTKIENDSLSGLASVGAAIEAGADVNKFIATLLTNILKEIIAIAGVITLPSSNDSKMTNELHKTYIEKEESTQHNPGQGWGRSNLKVTVHK